MVSDIFDEKSRALYKIIHVIIILNDIDTFETQITYKNLREYKPKSSQFQFLFKREHFRMPLGVLNNLLKKPLTTRLGAPEYSDASTSQRSSNYRKDCIFIWHLARVESHVS